MKTDMHINSLRTWDAIQEALPKARAKVMAELCRHSPCTRQELSAVTGIPINCVTGRVRELVEVGLIYEEGDRRGESGKPQAILHLKKLGESQLALL